MILLLQISVNLDLLEVDHRVIHVKEGVFTVVVHDRWWGHTSQGQEIERKSVGPESF